MRGTWANGNGSMRDILATIIDAYYHPNHNFFFIPHINGYNLHLQVYVMIAATAMGILLLRVFRKGRARKDAVSPLLIAGWIFLALMVGLQSASQAFHFFGRTIPDFQDKNLDEKLDVIYALESYRFVRVVLANVQEPCRGDFVADSETWGTIDPFLIRYYLYPVVDMVKKEAPADCVVVYNKENPTAAVPEGFEVIAVYDAKSLFAARRK